MKLYPAIISKNEENAAENMSLDDHVKVRIPAFHGASTDITYNRLLDSNGNKVEVNAIACGDSSLPWAYLNRGFGDKEFSAQDFNDGDIVYVMLENDDVNTPIITGYASRFLFTEDPETAEANISGNNTGTYGGTYPDGSCEFEEFTGANNIVRTAKSQVGNKDDGNNKCKYNTAYYGREVSGSNYAWCCAFVWWVFNNTKINGESAASYFYGGNKTANCDTLMNYYKKKGQFITTGFEPGDIIFFNWDNPKNSSDAQHVGIVIEKQVNPGDDVITIEGNTSSNGSQSYGGHVMKKNRKMTNIIGAARLGVPKEESICTGTNEEQVFKFLTRGMSLTSDNKQFNVAAACGILANIEKESSFNPNVVGDKGTSYGLCQWHDTSSGSGRYTNLKNFCNKHGYDYKTITGQMFYLQNELNTGYTGVRNSLLNVPNTLAGAKQAADIWCRKFEIPANVDSTAANRASAAESKYWPKYGA